MKVKACGFQLFAFAVQCLYHRRAHIPKEGIRWCCRNSAIFSVFYCHQT